MSTGSIQTNRWVPSALSPVRILLVSIALGALFRFWPLSPESEYPPGAQTQSDRLPHSPPVSYRPNTEALFASFSLLHLGSLREPEASPDTTAVVLNWSRFHNVQRIASLFCSPELHGTIKEVFVWNNNPKAISYHDFVNTTCPESKLRVFNSPDNLYFHARFIACSQSSTAHCFIQDDDYLILPEIVQAVSSRIAESRKPTAIYLLPPHEHLTTSLRTITQSSSSHVHTSFTWLGYGSIIHRSLATAFLYLLDADHLHVTADELKMADNYFSILRNEVPEAWFDQGIELGGGQAFTVGSAGEERNRKHILRAARYLDSLVQCDRPPCLQLEGRYGDYPYVSFESSAPNFRDTTVRTPCVGRPCVLETTIPLLPGSVTHSVDSASDILSLEKRNLEAIGADGEQHYVSFPPSFAVDGRPETVFRSRESAKNGDSIVLDMLEDIEPSWSTTEMAWLVDTATERILSDCAFEASIDGRVWEKASAGELTCFDVPDPAEGAQIVRECSVRMAGRTRHARFFRARVDGGGKAEKWAVHEVWMRGERKQI